MGELSEGWRGLTPAENKIMDAVVAIESMEAAGDPRLASALALLWAAKASVADYVDGREGVTRSVSTHRHFTVEVGGDA